MDHNVFSPSDAVPAASAWPSRETVLARLINLLNETVQDWDVPSDLEITASTELVHDLGCSSVDIIGIVVAIEEEFGTRNLGFSELLFRNNRYVDDVSVGELASFVAAKLEACVS